MVMHISKLAIFALGLACWSSAPQNRKPAGQESDSRPAVRLEAHNGQTQFKLGDPVMLDLVFTSRLPGYRVDTDTAPYRPTPDMVRVTPEEGWTRSHRTYLGLSVNGNAEVSLGSSPVRVPVVLNQTITFQKPGHYEVTLTTERLILPDSFRRWTTCDACRTTNSVGIEITARDGVEEASLVASLSHEIESNYNCDSQPGSGLDPEQKAALLREIDAQQKALAAGNSNQKQLQALGRKMKEVAANEMALYQKCEDTRREAAVRLAYLPGDDAVRAKVHFVVEDKEAGDNNPVGLIMVVGLPSSQNKQLQLDLLQAAWRDPKHVPTSVLQTALREAKELNRGQPVTDEAILWGGTPQDRQAALAEYREEINEIAATLPQRTEPNRTETLKFLKTRGVPNQFH